MEALWVHQWHNVVKPICFAACSARPARKRAPPPAVWLCYWRDRVPDALALFKPWPTTKSHGVRLEAVSAAPVSLPAPRRRAWP